LFYRPEVVGFDGRANLSAAVRAEIVFLAIKKKKPQMTQI
jgi:hypothetical protein